MKFKKITLDDIATISPYFSLVQSFTCDFSVGGMFMWRDYFDMEYLIDDGVFISRLRDIDGNTYFNLPLCQDIDAGIEKVVREYADVGEQLAFSTVPELYIPAFRRVCPDISLTEQTDYFDYLYHSSDLMGLQGKKYSGQRNQISQFERGVESWEFRDITDVSIDALVDFYKSVSSLSPDADSSEAYESRIVLEVLSRLKDYGMFGGVLLADGRIVGFSLGEKVNRTLITHIEKADRSCKGAFQMLVHQFALKFAADTVFINREDDMGDLGLRTSKKAYHPMAMLKKYIVTIK